MAPFALSRLIRRRIPAGGNSTLSVVRKPGTPYSASPSSKGSKVFSCMRSPKARGQSKRPARACKLQSSKQDDLPGVMPPVKQQQLEVTGPIRLTFKDEAAAYRSTLTCMFPESGQNALSPSTTGSLGHRTPDSLSEASSPSSSQTVMYFSDAKARGVCSRPKPRDLNI
mmetsp:Transcript_96395/g.171353  ORF Transcript_96395/g.171353 Transcript_96395/m.171353 type:complete len:169 (+) Transcript_96395:44-550(+)